jgi:cyclopropane fatty-acyl-phospholipid synthase-like methyltransferase
MNFSSLHHQAIREQYSETAGAAFYRSVMGDGAPVIHYGIYATPSTTMRKATEAATRQLLAIALDHFAGSRVGNIIDLGAGPGGSAHLLARELGAKVMCVDLCEHHHRENVTTAHELGLADLIEAWTGSFESLPTVWDQSFDLAWSQEALCHAQDKSAAFCEARRVLGEGGVFVFSDILLSASAPEKEAEAFRQVNAVTQWSTSAEHIRDVTNAGFAEIIHIDWTEHLHENFRRMKLQIQQHRERLIREGVASDLLGRFSDSLDKRLAWVPGSVLEWGAFVCR